MYCVTDPEIYARCFENAGKLVLYQSYKLGGLPFAYYQETFLNTDENQDSKYEDIRSLEIVHLVADEDDYAHAIIIAINCSTFEVVRMECVQQQSGKSTATDDFNKWIEAYFLEEDRSLLNEIKRCHPDIVDWLRDEDEY